MKTLLPALAAALALLVSACSQTPESIAQTPGLEPQFGTSGEDTGMSVAFNSAGHLYSFSKTQSHYYDEYYGESSSVSNLLLHRYDRNGNLLWERSVESEDCYYYSDCADKTAVEVGVDRSGNAYTLTHSSGEYCYDYDSEGYGYYTASYKRSRIQKTSSSGSQSWDIEAGNSVDFAVDANGGIYVVGDVKTEYGSCDYDDAPSVPSAYVVTKYNSDGTLQWQRRLSSAVGAPQDVAVDSSGNIYVLGTSGFSRYSNSGSVAWTKSGGGGNITVAGSSVFINKSTTLRKHSTSGSLLWTRTQSGLNSPAISDLKGDSSGNVYFIGRVNSSRGDADAFVRKINSSGSVVWTKPFGTPGYDTARGFATVSGSEVYVTGSTDGTLSHPNQGGLDGYLRKMDSSGNRVWTR